MGGERTFINPAVSGGLIRLPVCHCEGGGEFEGKPPSLEGIFATAVAALFSYAVGKMNTKTNTSRTAGMLLLLLFLMPANALAQGMVGGGQADVARIARNIEELTNQARARQGIPAAGTVDWLVRAAAGHSLEMLQLNYFSHYSPSAQQQTPRQRIEAASGGSPKRTGENIYRCSGFSPEQVAERTVNAWLASPSHYKNVMNPLYTGQGVAVVQQGETFVVTQNFGG